ncbi:MAG: deoxyhypusine synthase [Parcubacteria group bacterium Greene0416_14]|nr:MAG: deoxyhypusine synthase [Parcubacteria group bacterium Greene0416_14]TSD01325.1 MAG: deoxyhypusine synthase [Parcubacteria group bacterium Greene1014_15]TSD08013.1 MAG: deoxyhypusine synthase [Parcubacteria group bacterium Greene0714_4]
MIIRGQVILTYSHKRDRFSRVIETTALCNSKEYVMDEQARPVIGPPVMGQSVATCASLGNIFTNALTAFGGAMLSRLYSVLATAIRNEIPLVVSIAGPITLSDQHRTWLIPMIERGWIAYISTTDAVCYHDGHDALEKFSQRPIGRLPLFGDDAANLKEGIIRVTNLGFEEQILFSQDKMISAVLCRPEFQKKMTTTERNHHLGKYYHAAEEAYGVRPGLLSTCYRHALPVFIGAPADGSTFLNSVKLWALDKLGSRSYQFDYDLHADVFEACAYHHWGLFKSPKKSLALLILGGGVPKNYALQPEPALSQILLLENVRGYDYDVQIVSSPVTDGSLSGCYPSEAVSWGKVNPETYVEQSASVQADYSMLMPFVIRALFEDRTLVTRPHLRLYHVREKLTAELLSKVSEQLPELEDTLAYTLHFRETNTSQ